MKIHMRNIVEGAIIRGLGDGYLAVKPALLSAKTDTEEFAAISQIVDAIWDELDLVIDFTDEDDDEQDTKLPMGFAHRPAPEPADAIGAQEVSGEEAEDDEPVEDARLRLRRMRRYLQRRR